MAKILLVEDNEMNRDMLSRRLERRGYQVVQAVDGAQGVEMARAEMPDLIMMDMSLPVLDGWEATRRIKSDEAIRAHPRHRADRPRHVRRPRARNRRRLRRLRHQADRAAPAARQDRSAVSSRAAAVRAVTSSPAPPPARSPAPPTDRSQCTGPPAWTSPQPAAGAGRRAATWVPARFAPMESPPSASAGAVSIPARPAAAPETPRARSASSGRAQQHAHIRVLRQFHGLVQHAIRLCHFEHADQFRTVQRPQGLGFA